MLCNIFLKFLLEKDCVYRFDLMINMNNLLCVDFVFKFILGEDLMVFTNYK